MIGNRTRNAGAQIATHLAELPQWLGHGAHQQRTRLQQNPYTLPEINDLAALLAFLEENFISK